VSRWALSFPWPKRSRQREQLAALTDIIVKVRYTAKEGGPAFSREVQKCVAQADASAQGVGK
jgi:hypothetical protein